MSQTASGIGLYTVPDPEDLAIKIRTHKSHHPFSLED